MGLQGKDYLKLGADGEDKVIWSMITSEEFLKTCIIKGLKADYFSSEIRRELVGNIYEYFQNYGKPPRSDFVNVLFDGKKLTDKAAVRYVKYFSKLTLKLDNLDFSEKFLLDRIEEFIKRRISFTAIDKLLRYRESPNPDPNKLIEIMNEAVVESQKSDGKLFHTFNGLKSSFYDLYLTNFGVEEIDSQIFGGFKPRDFGIILGYTGRGKTWSMIHLAKRATIFGNSVLLIVNEASNALIERRLTQCYAGVESDQIGKLSRYDMKRINRKIENSMTKHSRVILVNEEEKGMRVDLLPSYVEQAERDQKRDINLILIDSPDDMLPPRGRYKSDFEATTAKYTFLKNYAKDKEKAIVVTCQSQRIGETKYWLNSGNVGDNINKVRKATIGISINAIDLEVNNGMGRFFLFKHTEGVTGAKAWFKSKLDRGQLIVKSGKYNHEEYSNTLKLMGAKQ